MPSWIDVNQAALLVILLIAYASTRRGLPVIIAGFYIAYMGIEIIEPLTTESGYYLLNVLLDIGVLYACVCLLKSGRAYITTTLMFMLYIAFFYAFPDLMLFLLHKTAFRDGAKLWYDIIMQSAVFIDILFALIGSNNRISRMLFKDS